MDVEVIKSLINDIGFPIVCCGVLAYIFYFFIKSFSSKLSECTEALNNNTVVMNEMLSLIKELKSDVEQVADNG